MNSLDELVAAIEAGAGAPEPELVHAMAGSLHGFRSPGHDPRLAAALRACLEAEISSDENLARVAAEQLRHGHAAGDPAALANAGIEVLEDPLCAALLRHARNVDAALELAITRHRRSLLLAARRPGVQTLRSLVAIAFRGAPPPVLGAAELDVACAIAIQGHINDHVAFSESDERDAVERLAGGLGGVDWSAHAAASEWTGALALYAMYRPVSTLECAARIAANAAAFASPALAALLTQTLDLDLRSREKAAQVQRVGSQDAAVTGAVRAQYEEHPYPSWRIAPAHPSPTTVVAFVDQRFPGCGLSMPSDVDVLVAGCGTGRQAIASARWFPDARVTATDISSTGLGYAAAMAERLGVDNLRFVQNDILDLDALGARFHLIECVGVLHHLAEPAAGLQALKRSLHAGGLMRIGLYSEVARRSIVAAHERIEALALEPTRDDMRTYRRRIMLGEEPEIVWEVMRNADFYTLGAFRDMLFHVMEHRFQMADIAAMLESAGLESLGVEPPSVAIESAYRAAYPEDAALADLDHWAAFEQANPETFRRMAVLWCRERAAA